MGGKLFSTSTMFEVAHTTGLFEYPKQVTCMAFMNPLLIEALTVCQDRVFASFLYISFIIIRFRKLKT